MISEKLKAYIKRRKAQELRMYNQAKSEEIKKIHKTFLQAYDEMLEGIQNKEQHESDI